MLQYGLYVVEGEEAKQFDDYSKIKMNEFKDLYVKTRKPIKIEQIFIGYSEKYKNDYMTVCFEGENEEKLILQTSSKYFMNSLYKNLITSRGFLNSERCKKVTFKIGTGIYGSETFEYVVIR